MVTPDVRPGCHSSSAIAATIDTPPAAEPYAYSKTLMAIMAVRRGQPSCHAISSPSGCGLGATRRAFGLPGAFRKSARTAEASPTEPAMTNAPS